MNSHLITYGMKKFLSLRRDIHPQIIIKYGDNGYRTILK